MHQEQRRRTHALLKEKGIDRALFAKWESVKWLTGFAPSMPTGGNLFEAGSPMVWYEDRHFTLIVIDAYANVAAALDPDDDFSFLTYEGYTIVQPIAGGERLTEVLQKIAAGSRGGRLGIEQYHATVMMLSILGGSSDFVAIDGWLEPLRMVKTAEEIAKLRKNFALTDIGHAAARSAVAAGKREIDIWTAIHGAIQQVAGSIVPLGNDCVVSSRAFNIGGLPLDYELLSGHSLMVDLSTVYAGYWSDSCATYYAGERTLQQAAMHQTVLEALEFGISLIRPGTVAKSIDQQVRQFIADRGYPVYPHHTGHGVGVSGHEAPRLVPYSDEILQPGMVIMLEPGIYFPGEAAVRVEDAVLVTVDGCEILTHHDKS